MAHSDAVQLVIFSRQLATMVAAGLPLPQAITIIGEQSDSKEWREVLFAIRDDIKAGASFYEALAKHPGVFDDLYVGMVKSGDTGGNLDVILERLASHLEKTRAARRTIRNTVTLPFLSSIAAAVAGIWLASLYSALLLRHLVAAGRPVPPATEPFLEALAWISANRWLPGLVILAAVVVVAAVATARTSRFSAGLTLRLPLLGWVARRIAVARFARITATGLSSGVPILDTLDIAARCTRNRVVRDAITEARGNVREGAGIAGPLKATGILPPMVVQMIAAGEETGKLDDMLLKVADFYDSEVEQALDWPVFRTVCLATGISMLVAGLTLVLFVGPLAG